MEWIWREFDEERFQRSEKTKPAQIDGETAVFVGDHGTYHCTLTHCTCQDFQTRLHGQNPCKHILALGAALGAYDVDAVRRKFERERLRAHLAVAYGYYYLFDEPIVPDTQYDEMKARYNELTDI